MSNQWIYDKVNGLVKKYRSRDPDELIAQLNIHLKYMDATESLLGMYRVILRNRFIFLPNNVGRLRKTVLAHELGHDQLHRRESMEGATFHEIRSLQPTNRYEMEANIFAAHLLIPDEEILRAADSPLSDGELAANLGVDVNLLHLKIAEMVKMKLLDLDASKLWRPHADFLKDYRPEEELWKEAP
ncbi:MAG: ImmA/IrrE family metallo-endopeptidase [Tissierellia bacterium]|nr:ImmA/IrrE family metallo-endopeptidase [Tissierellia bacterium]